MYATLKLIHVALAALTIGGFLLRGFWMLTDSAWLQRRLVRVVPHVLDTVFLLSGVGLILVMRLQVLQNNWLLVKFAALILYIVLGTIALKRGPTKKIRTLALAAAIVTFVYVIGVALSKSSQSWLAIV